MSGFSPTSETYSRFETIGPSQSETVGIDDLSVYIPKLCLPVTGEFSASRGIDPAKLRDIGRPAYLTLLILCRETEY